ncbi:hypothetical protein JQV27_16050 [Sulfitobacter mediterraneus]|uniref:hypothetical protein n=1 Tax=Sulfitobacter mediterraneus TaxID=83219 RepID=UPI001931429B|nr:hypothetical protein [Sulfitobacter mediterraneus]MBM1634364.1 hypothetical protein [Sulfitobacter mediterraneus]MBM1642181.1 hypothetical protein [Sulfitobacter mediterraneus]MBM1646230.1 hypothetical protein [Sulfitobacter mediterraneus]MBM1650276.1 hypothetical protein [Sulfitobacter mediterraneus]MBM1654298.1 hypothetical protein [Sulfitobacter mediterraneus]
MTVSTLPFLFAAQIAFGLLFGFRASAAGLRTMGGIAAALSVWACVTAWMALSGIYDSGLVLSLMPGLWLPVVPFILVGIFLLSHEQRQTIFHIAGNTPSHWLVAVQSLRILAIGTLIKTAQGTFPLEVLMAIGLTDLAFGFSALPVFVLVRNKRIHKDALVLWHLVGVALILVPGMLALQTGLPGPMQMFDRYPTSAVMLDWPMALGPTLVVPVFLIFNLLGAVAAWRAASPNEGFQT